VEFAVGYSGPTRGRTRRRCGSRRSATSRNGVTGWLLNGRERGPTVAHFAASGRTGSGPAPDPNEKHKGITLNARPASTSPAWRSVRADHGDERTIRVFSSRTSSSRTTNVVGEVRQGVPVISQALGPRAVSRCSNRSRRSTQRLDTCCGARPTTRPSTAKPLRHRSRRAPPRRPARDQAEWPRVLAAPGRTASVKARRDRGRAPATVESCAVQALPRRSTRAGSPTASMDRRVAPAPSCGPHRDSGRWRAAPTVDLPLHGHRHDRRRVPRRSRERDPRGRGLGLPKNF